MHTLEAIGSSSILQQSSALDVKVFVHKDPREAEQAIAGWLKENKVLIHHIGQSQGEKSGNFLFTLSVFFTRLEE